MHNGVKAINNYPPSVINYNDMLQTLAVESLKSLVDSGNDEDESSIGLISLAAQVAFEVQVACVSK